MYSSSSAKLLIIDNYDSFTHNLAQMFRRYDLAITVCRNDRITVARVGELKPDYILISSGPKDPAAAGVSIPLIRAFYATIPILGVCLGMQCINEVFGGRTVRAPQPLHGKTSPVFHHHKGIFEGLPSPFKAARYHSLAVSPNGGPLEVIAQSVDGVIMGLLHPNCLLQGVQFHPESFLTQYGFWMVENFLRSGPLGFVKSGRRDADGPRVSEQTI